MSELVGKTSESDFIFDVPTETVKQHGNAATDHGNSSHAARGVSDLGSPTDDEDSSYAARKGVDLGTPADDGVFSHAAREVVAWSIVDDACPITAVLLFGRGLVHKFGKQNWHDALLDFKQAHQILKRAFGQSHPKTQAALYAVHDAHGGKRVDEIPLESLVMIFRRRGAGGYLYYTTTGSYEKTSKEWQCAMERAMDATPKQQC